jgi:hypothetical protein
MMGLDLDQFFDKQIGDWRLLEEIDRRKASMEINSPATPQMQEMQEPVDGNEKKSNV